MKNEWSELESLCLGEWMRMVCQYGGRTLCREKTRAWVFKKQYIPSAPQLLEFLKFINVWALLSVPTHSASKKDDFYFSASGILFILLRIIEKCWTIKRRTGGSDSKVSAHNVGDTGLSPWLGRSPGEGNGNPLQHSCLENPTDGGAWSATVYGVAKSRTRLSDFTSLHLGD